jgi:hypothetical protein
VSYVYDTAPNGIGHLAQMTDQAGKATYTLPDVSGAPDKTRERMYRNMIFTKMLMAT